jgi:hypothetical protein
VDRIPVASDRDKLLAFVHMVPLNGRGGGNSCLVEEKLLAYKQGLWCMELVAQSLSMKNREL